MIRDEGVDEMPLAEALAVADAVKHRRGGTDQALARLAKECARLKRIELDVEAIMADQGEFDSDMPDELWDKINGNRELTLNAFRLSINFSRRTLRARIEESFAEGRA
jgi:hypothetical protein